MHIQLVTYGLGEIGEQQYISLAHELAPQVANAPGLLSAVWLDGAETDTYGIVFFWESHSSMERFTNSPVSQSLFGAFGDVVMEHADVLENLTRQTQPSLQIVPSSAERGSGLPGAASSDSIG